MSGIEDSFDGGLVVNSGGYDGGYNGGGFMDNMTFSAVPGSHLFANTTGLTLNQSGMFVVLVLLLTVYVVWAWKNPSEGMHGGGRFGGVGDGNRGAAQWLSSPSDNITGFKGQRDRAAELIAGTHDAFINARETPYFPDVTNRVLRMENREKEAVRALGKIDQERLRRAAEDTSSTTPLPWGPFWKEWKATHVIDGEDVVSGFAGGVSSFSDENLRYS